jgi:hypothetical protein
MKQTKQRQRRLFELPLGSEQHLVWYGFLKRLPTTICSAVAGIRGGLCCAHHSPRNNPGNSQRYLAGTMRAGGRLA